MDRMKVTIFEMDHGDGHFYPTASYDVPRSSISPSSFAEMAKAKEKEVKDDE